MTFVKFIRLMTSPPSPEPIITDNIEDTEKTCLYPEDSGGKGVIYLAEILDYALVISSLPVLLEHFV